MHREKPDYLSYLLRLWRENDAAQPVWRASLQGSLTNDRQSFASLDDLFDFLREQTDTDEKEKGRKNR